MACDENIKCITKNCFKMKAEGQLSQKTNPIPICTHIKVNNRAYTNASW